MVGPGEPFLDSNRESTVHSAAEDCPFAEEASFKTRGKHHPHRS